MATLDLSEATDRIRLACGDTSDLPFLSDTEIEYSLSVNNNNETAATKQCAGFILARLAFETHSKIGALEVWTSESFNQYKAFLKEILTSSSFNAIGGVYVGGMELADVQANLQDTTLVQKRIINYAKDVYDDSDETLYGVTTDTSSIY